MAEPPAGKRIEDAGCKGCIYLQAAYQINPADFLDAAKSATPKKPLISVVGRLNVAGNRG